MQRAVEEKTDTQLMLALYRRMLELREFELKVQEVFRAGELPGFVHLYVGEEAVAAGVCAHLSAADMVYSTHRGHGHALAKGVPAREVMAELYGKATGCSGGRGGSMHMYAPEHGLMGTNGVVGSGIPMAAGAALSAQLRASGQVSVCFFGDGAVNSGSFHEGMNFAAVWNLPVVYVCENNLYATEMAFRRATKNLSVASRAAAYCMPGLEVDGNDVMAVHQAAGEAVGRARSGGGPALIECKTYRIVGHHEGDPGADYRTREEVESWRKRCPIRILRERARTLEAAGEDAFDQIHREVERWLEDAVEFARRSPQPDPASVLEHV
ncbi:MAG: thiamine pyrophosphate-dependent dehydrogenase E1 component subunit alpha [Acidobacteria bacterium]|nr:thiamine pyrophosphate-dependent dehydrogenase E1 component subunit alpha [Acidobacteriota bacterium]